MEPQAKLNSLSEQLQRLQQCLDEETLDTLARQSGYVARKLTGSLTFKPGAANPLPLPLRETPAH